MRMEITIQVGVLICQMQLVTLDKKHIKHHWHYYTTISYYIHVIQISKYELTACPIVGTI